MESGFSPTRRSPTPNYDQDASSQTNLKQFRPVDVFPLADSTDKTRQLQKKVTYLSRTMHHNLQAAMLRGDDLVDLERRAGSLELGSKAFRMGDRIDNRRDERRTSSQGATRTDSQNVNRTDSQNVNRTDSQDTNRAGPRAYPRTDSRAYPRSDSRTYPQSDSRTYPRSDSRNNPQSDSYYRSRDRKSPSPDRRPAKPTIDMTEVDADDEEAIARAMGFGGFDTTKGRHVVGNATGAVDKKKKKTEYRQILHRKKLYEVPLTRQQAEEKQQILPPE